MRVILSSLEKEKIEKVVRGRLKRQTKQVIAFSTPISSIISTAILGSTFIKKIERLIEKASNKLNVPSSSIRIKTEKPWAASYNWLVFYKTSLETKIKFEGRIKDLIKQKQVSEIKKKQRILKNKEIARIKKQTKLLKLVEELDIDIYEIFKDINKKDNPKF